MKKSSQSFWIKERYNPQLGTYYVARGQMTKAAARAERRSLYGDNIMHEYATEAEYETKLAELSNAGKSVQRAAA